MTAFAKRAKRWTGIDTASISAFVIGAGIRFAVMIVGYMRSGTVVMTQGDTRSYLEPGRNLMLHGVFHSAGMPEIDRTPGFPIFVTLSGMLWGNVLLAVSIQIVVCILSLLLVRRIANLAFPISRPGWIAALLYAIEPLSILYAVRLMPETLFSLLLVIVIERLLTFHADGRLSLIVQAGVALAAATYVRPVSYYLVVPLSIGLIFVSPPKMGRWWKAPLMMLIVVVPLLAAWQVRNFMESGYSGFSSIVEKNLYFFQSAEVTAELQHTSLEDQQRILGYPDDASYVTVHPEQRLWSRPQRLQFMKAQALQILSQNRWLYLRTHVTGEAIVAFTPCATEWMELFGVYPKDDKMPHRLLNEGVLRSIQRMVVTHPGTTVFMGFLEVDLLLLYVLSIIAIVIGTESRVATMTLMGVALYFLLISGGAQAVGRYRLPAMPEVCVLAAGGIAALKRMQRIPAEPTKLS